VRTKVILLRACTIAFWAEFLGQICSKEKIVGGRDLARISKEAF